MPVTANVADPGVVDTDLYRHVFWGTRLVKKLLGWWVFKVKAATLGVLLRSAGRSGFTLLDDAVTVSRLHVFFLRSFVDGY